MTPEIIYDYDDELKGGAHEACHYDLCKTLDRRQLRRYVRTFEIFVFDRARTTTISATTWLPLATTWLSMATTWLPLGYHLATTRLSLGYHLTTTKYTCKIENERSLPPPIVSRFGNEDGKSDIIRDGWTTEIICRKHTNNRRRSGSVPRMEERCYRG